MPASRTRSLRLHAPLRGDVIIRTRSVATGETLQRLQICNKILHNGFAALVALLDTADGARRIERLRIGTAATPPTVADVDVGGPIPATGAAYPWDKVDFACVKAPVASTVGGPYELVVTATVPGGSEADAYNGKTITEAALITVGGAAFSRQVHPAIQKTTAIAIDYEWRIRFIPA